MEPGDLVLRPEVKIERDAAGTINVRYALWEIAFPDEVVRGIGAFAPLLAERRLSVSKVEPCDAPVISFLTAQGCFLPKLDCHVRLREVLPLFEPLRSGMYAEYYSHPLWRRLRSGLATRAELLSWIIHNYHISRSAGPIAARMATHAPQARLRTFFRKDAVEEYWHCDSFYFVDNDDLALSEASAKAYIPLPASMAFEDHALRAAEEDWLGHLLIAYFQEASILFRGESEQFYDAVEEAFGLKGFFSGWRRHMALDLDHGHADGVRKAFDSDELISLADVERSMRTVQVAQFFLVRALDQIATQTNAADPVGCRQPKAIATADRDWLSQPSNRVGAAPTQRLDLGRYLIDVFGDAAVLALAFARSHDEIIAAGELATLMSAHEAAPQAIGSCAGTNGPTDDPWLVAVRNFVIERAQNVGVLLELGRELLAAAGECHPEMAPRIASFEEKRSRVAAKLRLAGTATVERFQLRELLDLALDGESLPPLVIGLRRPSGFAAAAGRPVSG
jgi:hypothetical protein